MIKYFRYNSPWEQFEEAVKQLKDLLERKKAFWLIGFLKDIDILVDESEGKVSEETENIIDDEILYLVRGILNNKQLDYESIKRGICRNYENIPEEDLEASVVSMSNKLELVKDTFEMDELLRRYKLKKNSVIHKMSGFDFNIITQSLPPDREEVKCAVINLSTQKRIAEDEKENDISFICDKDDVDVLIQLLQMVKTGMEGC